MKTELKENWPATVRQLVGYELGLVQCGLEPNRFREMTSIGPGVREIRVQDENKSQYRLIYVAKFEEAIYVFHVITKKSTQKTSKIDVEIARKRYQEIVIERRNR